MDFETTDYKQQNIQRRGYASDIKAIGNYCTLQVDSLWDEVKRFENPHNYYVDLSQTLWDQREKLLAQHSES